MDPGEEDLKGGAVIRLTFHMDNPVVGIDNTLHNGQAQACYRLKTLHSLGKESLI